MSACHYGEGLHGCFEVCSESSCRHIRGGSDDEKETGVYNVLVFVGYRNSKRHLLNIYNNEKVDEDLPKAFSCMPVMRVVHRNEKRPCPLCQMPW